MDNVGRCWPFEGAQGQLGVTLSRIVQALLVGDGLSATREELMWMPSVTGPSQQMPKQPNLKRVPLSTSDSARISKQPSLLAVPKGLQHRHSEQQFRPKYRYGARVATHTLT